MLKNPTITRHTHQIASLPRFAIIVHPFSFSLSSLCTTCLQSCSISHNRRVFSPCGSTYPFISWRYTSSSPLPSFSLHSLHPLRRVVNPSSFPHRLGDRLVVLCLQAKIFLLQQHHQINVPLCKSDPRRLPPSPRPPQKSTPSAPSSSAWTYVSNCRIH